MNGQRFDIARVNEILIVEKAKLAGFEQAALDLTEAKGLTESLSEMKAVLEAAQTRNSDLNDSIKLTQLKFGQLN